jgi:hypothetical protein
MAGPTTVNATGSYFGRKRHAVEAKTDPLGLLLPGHRRAENDAAKKEDRDFARTSNRKVASSQRGETYAFDCGADNIYRFLALFSTDIPKNR